MAGAERDNGASIIRGLAWVTILALVALGYLACWLGIEDLLRDIRESPLAQWSREEW